MTQPSIPMNDLSRSVLEDRAAISTALERVVDSGWFIHGREHEAFESEFATFVGSTHCIGVANGTDAIEVALRTLGVKSGDKVCTIANAGFYSSTACLAIDAIPVYVDVDPSTLTMSPDALRHALKIAPRAVIATHLYGGLGKIEEISTICREAGVPLIEDCAQATGAIAASGARAGSIGDLGCFSFYPTKNLGAIGDGGAVVTSSDALADRCRQVRQYGWSTRYAVAEVGVNSRLDDLQAAVLRHRLTRLDERNQRRREIAATYQRALADAGCAERLVFTNDPSHVAHLAVVVTDRRDVLRSALETQGVSCDVHYPISDDLQELWELPRRFLVSGNLEATHHACESVLSIPCFPEMTDSEVALVGVALTNAVRSAE